MLTLSRDALGQWSLELSKLDEGSLVALTVMDKRAGGTDLWQIVRPWVPEHLDLGPGKQALMEDAAKFGITTLDGLYDEVTTLVCDWWHAKLEAVREEVRREPLQVTERPFTTRQEARESFEQWCIRQDIDPAERDYYLQRFHQHCAESGLKPVTRHGVRGYAAKLKKNPLS
jgi:hypothetical protein